MGQVLPRVSHPVHPEVHRYRGQCEYSPPATVTLVNTINAAIHKVPARPDDPISETILVFLYRFLHVQQPPKLDKLSGVFV